MIVSRFAKWLGFGAIDSTSRPDAWPPATWRNAEPHDWPPVEKLGDDFDWVHRNGRGFVAEFLGKKWFLFDRDWFGWPDPPEWSLASFQADGDGWRFFNDFDVLPENWLVPKVSDAENR